jgi:cytochrome c oxidase subunit 4
MSEHVISSKMYYAIWATLMVLTVVTALVATVDLGRIGPIDFNTVAALVIATGKASLVVLFFMHVKYTNERFTKVVVISALFWLLILLFLSMTDYSTRGTISSLAPVHLR